MQGASKYDALAIRLLFGVSGWMGGRGGTTEEVSLRNRGQTSGGRAHLFVYAEAMMRTVVCLLTVR